MTGEQVRRLEQRRWSARLDADAASLRDLFADDLVFVHSSGRVETKDSFIAELESGRTRYVAVERSNETVRVVGDVALVHGDAAVRVRAGENERGRGMRYLAVWTDGPRGPRMAAWQASPLPSDA